jgi:sugar phosphate permease
MSLKVSYRAWVIWLLAAGFFFAEYFARVAPSVMTTDLMRAFNVTAGSLGALSAMFYYAYVGMQLPVGALVDRFGPQKLLTIMSVICGVGCLFFAYSGSLSIASLARFMMGFAAAFAFVGALKLAKVWFPASRFGLMAGATQALGMLGAAMGEGPVSVLVKKTGWQHAMLLIGIVLIILAVLIFLIVRDKPKYAKERKQEPHYNLNQSLWQGLWQVLQSKQTWINGCVVGFLYAPTAAFAELWGPSYLHRVYAISPEVAASAISVMFIGWGISSPMVGWVSDKIKRRKPVLLGSAIFSGVFMSLVLYVPSMPVALMFVLVFLYGVSNVGVATSYAVASEICPKSLSGTSMSFANMASVIIGAFFQPIIGWLLDLGWNGKMLHGAPWYSATDYRMAMLALPACFIVSIIFVLFLKESYQK